MAPSTLARSIRLTPLQRDLLAAIKDEDQAVSTRSFLAPRKEANILASAIKTGINEVYRRTVGWQWSCDTCNTPIRRVTDGKLQWLTTKTSDGVRSAYDLKLVHRQRNCVFNEAQLPHHPAGTVGMILISDDGLDSMLDQNLFMNVALSYTWHNKSEPRLMYRRLFVPGVEQLRSYIDDEDELLHSHPSHLVRYIETALAVGDTAAVTGARAAMGLAPDDDDE